MPFCQFRVTKIMLSSDIPSLFLPQWSLEAPLPDKASLDNWEAWSCSGCKAILANSLPSPSAWAGIPRTGWRATPYREAWCADPNPVPYSALSSLSKTPYCFSARHNIGILHVHAKSIRWWRCKYGISSAQYRASLANASHWYGNGSHVRKGISAPSPPASYSCFGCLPCTGAVVRELVCLPWCKCTKIHSRQKRNVKAFFIKRLHVFIQTFHCFKRNRYICYK